MLCLKMIQQLIFECLLDKMKRPLTPNKFDGLFC